MDTKTIGKWVYLLGILAAVVVALFIDDVNEWITWILMAAGILAGWWYAEQDDIKGRAIRYLGLAAVAASLDGFLTFGDFNLGGYITTIVGAVVVFLGPVLLTALTIRFVKKITG